MSASVFNVAIDCVDPYELAQFWSGVTGRQVSPDCVPGAAETSIDLGGLNLYFQRVPELRRGKNRVHVCLRPDQLRDVEVERVRALGATLVADHRKPHGRGWVVLADPEGNEFCMLRHDIS